jgi:membrane fusion protein (multidrug efflux system)
MRSFSFQYFLFIAFVLLFSCKEDEIKGEDQPLESFRAEVSATPVRIAQAERKSFDYLINATGKIEALSQVKVSAERSGILEMMQVKEGDFVEKGKILARMDLSENQLKLEKSKIALKNAEVNYQSEALSFAEVFQGNDENRKKEIEDYLKIKSGFYAAELDLKEAEMDLEKSTIKAPISGRIADLKAKSGGLVNAGDELFEIINTGQLELKVKVLESDINLISIGQNAEIYPVGGGFPDLTGTVRSINPKVDENGLVQVSILVRSTKGLLPGMNARAIIRAPQNNSLVVPKEALVYRSNRPVVFTIENDESKWNYVEVGKDNGREVEVLSGIEAGMTVITSNNLQLAHQAPVQIIKD